MSNVRNHLGETLDECTDRLLRERVTARVAETYALTVVLALEGSRRVDRDHLITFYKTVARILSITQDEYDIK